MLKKFSSKKICCACTSAWTKSVFFTLISMSAPMSNIILLIFSLPDRTAKWKTVSPKFRQWPFDMYEFSSSMENLPCFHVSNRWACFGKDLNSSLVFSSNASKSILLFIRNWRLLVNNGVGYLWSFSISSRVFPEHSMENIFVMQSLVWSPLRIRHQHSLQLDASLFDRFCPQY